MKGSDLQIFIWRLSLGEKCPYLELFCSAFSRIWTENGDILRISPYSVRMRENMIELTDSTGKGLEGSKETFFHYGKVVNKFHHQIQLKIKNKILEEVFSKL